MHLTLCLKLAVFLLHQDPRRCHQPTLAIWMTPRERRRFSYNEWKINTFMILGYMRNRLIQKRKAKKTAQVVFCRHHIIFEIGRFKKKPTLAVLEIGRFTSRAPAAGELPYNRRWGGKTKPLRKDGGETWARFWQPPSQGKEATPMVTSNRSWKLKLNAFNKALLPQIAILGVKLPAHKFWGETSNCKQKYIHHKCYKASTECYLHNNSKTHTSKQTASW